MGNNFLFQIRACKQLVGYLPGINEHDYSEGVILAQAHSFMPNSRNLLHAEAFSPFEYGCS
jgi:hypothetical protein